VRNSQLVETHFHAFFDPCRYVLLGKKTPEENLALELLLRYKFDWSYIFCYVF
jgi:hypothetical protein